MQFQAADGSWHTSAELLVADGKEVDKDERIRAAFAPSEARLNSAYADPGLAFFLACRPRFEANVETLFRWMLQAKDDKTRAAAMKYFLHGNEAMRHRLASKAREAIQAGEGGWLKTVEEQPWFQNTCGEADQAELTIHMLRIRDSKEAKPASRRPPGKK